MKIAISALLVSVHMHKRNIELIINKRKFSIYYIIITNMKEHPFSTIGNYQNLIIACTYGVNEKFPSDKKIFQKRAETMHNFWHSVIFR